MTKKKHKKKATEVKIAEVHDYLSDRFDIFLLIARKDGFVGTGMRGTAADIYQLFWNLTASEPEREQAQFVVDVFIQVLIDRGILSKIDTPIGEA